MKKDKDELKSYFETGDKPTQQEYTNLIDSLRHEDVKIPLSDLEENPKVHLQEGNSHINIEGNGTLESPYELFVNIPTDNSKLDKNQGAGAANRRFVIEANGEVSVASELSVLENVTFIDSGDADTKNDSLRFTFAGNNQIDVNINELFDIGAFTSITENTASKELVFTTAGGNTVTLDLSTWFTKLDHQIPEWKPNDPLPDEGLPLYRMYNGRPYTYVEDLPSSTLPNDTPDISGNWELRSFSERNFSSYYQNKLDNQFNFPPPFLGSVHPLGVRVNETSFAINLYGSFFTPDTSVSIVDATVNSVEFINSMHLKVLISTGASENLLTDLTITSGGQSTNYIGKFFIIDGDLFIPTATDWINNTGLDVATTGEAKLITDNIYKEATINRDLLLSKDWEVSWTWTPSDLISTTDSYRDHFIIIDENDLLIAKIMTYSPSPIYVYNNAGLINYSITGVPLSNNHSNGVSTFTLKHLDNTLTYWADGVQKVNMGSTAGLPSTLGRIKISSHKADVINILIKEFD
jgi:hypothetical protein